MNIETFSSLIKKHSGLRTIRHYQTDVPDHRFGIPEKYVAATFEQNSQSTVFEFRIGLTSVLERKFNNLPGVSAHQHTTNNDMLVVTISNEAFNQDVLTLIDECTGKAVRKYFQQY